MMFMITLAFLVFTGANFKQIQFFLISISKFFAGANITVQKINVGSSDNFNVALDELKISDFLTTQVHHPIDNPKGVIESFAF